MERIIIINCTYYLYDNELLYGFLEDFIVFACVILSTLLKFSLREYLSIPSINSVGYMADYTVPKSYEKLERRHR